MVETITPVVYGGRARWAIGLLFHVAGAGFTAAMFGAAVGGLGALLGAASVAAGQVVVAVIAFAYLVGELSRRPLPVPQLRRQVPEWWRTFFPAPAAAFLYGAGLGVGFLTYLRHGTLVAVTALAFAGGRPGVGALMLGAFGVARGLSIAITAGARAPGDARGLVDRLSSSSGAVRRLANAAALLMLAGMTTVGAFTTEEWSWGPLAAAGLTLAFAWSAVVKMLVPGRWDRALREQGFPFWIERTARWAVPAAEALVPAAVMLGFAGLAAGWALVLLSGFSVALVRMSVRTGIKVPCGCFGGRHAVDVRVALLRNVLLGALGVIAAGVPAAPRVSWPGFPTATEIVPMVLACVGVGVTGWVAWRASAWLGRGARA